VNCPNAYNLFSRYGYRVLKARWSGNTSSSNYTVVLRVIGNDQINIVANLISIIPGMKSPTADINTTIGLALIVVLSVHIYGMIKKGVWKYLKEFASPIFMFPIELIGQFSRTLSLSMRLFGNILSGDLIVAIVFRSCRTCCRLR